jgi:hypothetical protein
VLSVQISFIIIGYLFPLRPSIILPRVANHAWWSARFGSAEL